MRSNELSVPVKLLLSIVNIQSRKKKCEEKEDTIREQKSVLFQKH